MNTREEWLKQIEDNPNDWQTVLIFADWLEDQGKELEAEQWRFAVQFVYSRKHIRSANLRAINDVIDLCCLGQVGTNSKDPTVVTARNHERNWTRRHRIRHIPFFPRRLSDLEATCADISPASRRKNADISPQECDE